MEPMAPAYRRVHPVKWSGSARDFCRDVAAEVAVAITYNGTTHAVMMATPSDLEDFAYGFALTEGLVEGVDQIERFEAVEHPNGIEARLRLKDHRAETLLARRRHMAGPTGCGLCGIESLDQVRRAVEPVSGGRRLAGRQIVEAMAELRQHQTLNALTRAVHGAAFWTPSGIRALREDVGRHNALDKLIGALLRRGEGTENGALLLTSRLSLELVQKAAIARCPVLVAVSAPTTAALETAQALGMTMLGVTRDDGFEIFCHPWRIDI